jgi:hypothetical protein
MFHPKFSFLIFRNKVLHPDTKALDRTNTRAEMVAIYAALMAGSKKGYVRLLGPDHNRHKHGGCPGTHRWGMAGAFLGAEARPQVLLQQPQPAHGCL